MMLPFSLKLGNIINLCDPLYTSIADYQHVRELYGNKEYVLAFDSLIIFLSSLKSIPYDIVYGVHYCLNTITVDGVYLRQETVDTFFAKTSQGVVCFKKSRETIRII